MNARALLGWILLFACGQPPLPDGPVAREQLSLELQSYYDQNRCTEAKKCGALIRISCRPEVDGPEGYFDSASSKQVASCGGACMAGCPQPCPPDQWTCGR